MQKVPHRWSEVSLTSGGDYFQNVRKYAENNRFYIKIGMEILILVVSNLRPYMVAAVGLEPTTSGL